MTDSGYPERIVPTGHVEPAPRRLRGVAAGELIFDTIAARYVWEWPRYPTYYVPLADVRADLLTPEGHTQSGHLGEFELHALNAGGEQRPRAAKVLHNTTVDSLADTVRFDWSALDAWYEEDEQVFVHARDPYVRVDALRSTRRVRVELDGTLLADSTSPVMVFETGLPTRYYLPRPDVDLDRLTPSPTVTACPYKGITSAYWSARIGETDHTDIAWAYDFPTGALLPIAGLIAFYNERTEITVGHPSA